MTVLNPVSYRQITATVTAPGTVVAGDISNTVQADTAPAQVAAVQNRFKDAPMTHLPLKQLASLARTGADAVGLQRRRPHREYRPAAGAGADHAIRCPSRLSAGLAADAAAAAASHAVEFACGRSGSRSFFHDPRASHIGDLLTVDISIADAAKISDTTKRRRDNSDNAGLSNFFGLEGPLAAALPAGADPSKLVNMASTTSNAGTGSVDRSEQINLTLAAIVTQVLPNGNLVIRGHQQVRVNNELRDLQISGIVRTEDITNANTVNLSQIAEARISYGGKGQITDVQQPRYGQQLSTSSCRSDRVDGGQGERPAAFGSGRIAPWMRVALL